MHRFEGVVFPDGGYLAKSMRQKSCLGKCGWMVVAVVCVGGWLAVTAARASEPRAGQGRPTRMTNVLTLEVAIQLALESNPEARASGARVNAAAGRAYQAKKWMNPELELRAEDWPLSN